MKIKVLKSQGVKCRCMCGVTLPMGYLQVVGWWQRWCFRIQHCALWGSLRPGSPTSTRVTHWLRITRQLRHSITRRAHCSSFSVPTKETMQVYSHPGTHATPAVKSAKFKIVTVTYECSKLSSEVLPWITVYVTCLSTVSTSTSASSWEPLEIKHKKLW